MVAGKKPYELFNSGYLDGWFYKVKKTNWCNWGMKDLRLMGWQFGCWLTGFPAEIEALSSHKRGRKGEEIYSDPAQPLQLKTQKLVVV